MWQKLLHLCPTSVHQKGPFLHDNIWLRVLQMILQKMSKWCCGTLPNSVYSSDLFLTDYLFFNHLSNFLQEEVFNNQAVAHNVFEEFLSFRTLQFYTTKIDKCVYCWQHSIDSDSFFISINNFILSWNQLL